MQENLINVWQQRFLSKEALLSNYLRILICGDISSYQVFYSQSLDSPCYTGLASHIEHFRWFQAQTRDEMWRFLGHNVLMVCETRSRQISSRNAIKWCHPEKNTFSGSKVVFWITVAAKKILSLSKILTETILCYTIHIPAFWCAGDYQSDNHSKTPPHIAKCSAIELFIPYVLAFLRAHRASNS